MDQRPEITIPFSFHCVSVPIRADPYLRQTSGLTPKTVEKNGPMRSIGLSNGPAT
jgi:hypothetical protein